MRTTLDAGEASRSVSLVLQSLSHLYQLIPGWLVVDLLYGHLRCSSWQVPGAESVTVAVGFACGQCSPTVLGVLTLTALACAKDILVHSGVSYD